VLTAYGEAMKNNVSVIRWLSFTAFMVLAMAVIGAITRLTESGLSMVEWRPLIGALPPMSEAEWQRVFSRMDGGLLYNTWPMMGEGFIPDEASKDGAFHNNAAGAQFFHRWIAIAAGFVILTYAMRVKSKPLGHMLFLQIGLGIATLLSQVMIPLAAAHQAGAFILVGLLLREMHKISIRQS